MLLFRCAPVCIYAFLLVVCHSQSIRCVQSGSGADEIYNGQYTQSPTLTQRGYPVWIKSSCGSSASEYFIQVVYGTTKLTWAIANQLEPSYIADTPYCLDPYRLLALPADPVSCSRGWYRYDGASDTALTLTVTEGACPVQDEACGPVAAPTTADPTTAAPTTADPTTAEPTSAEPTTADPTTAEPTTVDPTTATPLTETPTAVLTTSAPHRDYTNYTITIQVDDVNLTDTDVFLIVSNAWYNLSSTPLFVVISGANDDDRTTELVIAFPSDVELVTGVVETTVREAIVKEYPETEDRVHVTVEKNRDMDTQAKKFSDGTLIALVVFFVVFAAFLVVYVWKTRRGDKKDVAQERIRIGKIQRTNRVNDKQPGQQPDLVRVYSDDESPCLQASPGRAVNGNTVDFGSQSSLEEIGDQNANDNEVVSATPDGVTAGGVTENIVNVADDEFVVEEDGEGSENETTGGNGQ